MTESNNISDAMKRVVLPPRRRFSGTLPKTTTEAQVAVPAKTGLSTVPLAIPPPPMVVPLEPPEEKVEEKIEEEAILPPPGIARVSEIPQKVSFLPPPVQAKQDVEDLPEQQEEESIQIHNPLPFVEPDSQFDGETSVRKMSPIPVYLSLATSLIALGIQIWMLLSVRAGDN